MLQVVHNFSICHKNSSLPLGPIQPSSPSTKELANLVTLIDPVSSVTRLGDLLHFGELFKGSGNN